MINFIFVRESFISYCGFFNGNIKPTHDGAASWTNNHKSTHLFPQTLHAWLLTPLCVLLCAARLVYLENALPHIEHTNPFSLACALICSKSLKDCAKDLPHSLHGNGFSPVWVRRCLVRSSDLEKPLPHSLQRWRLAPSWTWVSSRILVFRKVPICISFLFVWLNKSKLWN